MSRPCDKCNAIQRVMSRSGPLEIVGESPPYCLQSGMRINNFDECMKSKMEEAALESHLIEQSSSMH